MSARITMDDGSEADLIEHLRHGHQKGTRGLTEEYLLTLHATLHQRRRDPMPTHTHPEADETGWPATA